MSPIVTALRCQIAEATAALDAYQAECPHLKDEIEYKPRSNSDDWDAPGKVIRYWYECHCTFCGKRWEEPQ